MISSMYEICVLGAVMFVFIVNDLLNVYILQESGNNQVVFMLLDLGSLKSVRAFVETFLKTEPRLDLLINNAGFYQKHLAARCWMMLDGSFQHMYTF